MLHKRNALNTLQEMSWILNPSPTPGHEPRVRSAQSKNRDNSGIVLRKVRILTLPGEVGILTLRKMILELLLHKVGTGTN